MLSIHNLKQPFLSTLVYVVFCTHSTVVMVGNNVEGGDFRIRIAHGPAATGRRPEGIRQWKNRPEPFTHVGATRQKAQTVPDENRGFTVPQRSPRSPPDVN